MGFASAMVMMRQTKINNEQPAINRNTFGPYFHCLDWLSLPGTLVSSTAVCPSWPRTPDQRIGHESRGSFCWPKRGQCSQCGWTGDFVKTTVVGCRSVVGNRRQCLETVQTNPWTWCFEFVGPAVRFPSPLEKWKKGRKEEQLYFWKKGDHHEDGVIRDGHEQKTARKQRQWVNFGKYWKVADKGGNKAERRRKKAKKSTYNKIQMFELFAKNVRSEKTGEFDHKMFFTDHFFRNNFVCGFHLVRIDFKWGNANF